MRSSRSIKRYGLLLGLGLAAGALAGLAVWGYRRLHQFSDTEAVAARAEKAEAAYRSAGLPWVADDLNPHPPVTDSDNAAIPFRQAMAALDARSPGTSGLDSAEADISRAARAGRAAEVLRLVRPFEPAMMRVSEATRRLRIDFHYDWDQGAALSFPELPYFKRFTKLFCYRAEAEAAAGMMPMCRADLTVAVGLLRLAAHQPLILGFLVHSSCDAILVAAVQQVAYERRSQAVDLGALLRIVENLPSRDLNQALREEAYMGLATCRNLRHEDYAEFAGLKPITSHTGPVAPLVRDGLPNGRIERSWATAHMEIWLRISRVMSEPSRNLLDAQRALDQIEDELEHSPTVSNMLEVITLPLFHQVFNVAVDALARHATLGGLLTAMQAKARTGRYPATLPGTWTDPYTGGPLHYKLSGGTVRVYSVGANLVDDDGRDQREVKAGSKDFDIVAACPPVTPRSR